MSFGISIKIGSLKIGIKSGSREWISFLSKLYGPFTAKPIGSPEVFIIPKLKFASKNKKLIIKRKRNSWVISRGDFFSVSNNALTRTSLIVDNNRYSFDSWLRVFLSLYGLKKNSLLVHAAGLRLGKNASVFPGRSGRGKSTLVRTLGKNNALSDEIVVLEKNGGSLKAFSTPFWGELKRNGNTNFAASLNGLYFLDSKTELRKTPINARTAFRKLLSTALFFSKDPAALRKLMKLSADITAATNSYLFGFTLKDTRNELSRIIK
jgi:hypothetical protein